MIKLISSALVAFSVVLSPVTAPEVSAEISGATPPIRALTAGAEAAEAYVTYSKACVNPGNPRGICWWEGWEFRLKNVCVESNIPGNPLAAVAKMFTIPGSLAVTYRWGIGSCAKAGFKASQTVPFTDYGRVDNRDAADYCAYTAPQSYGHLTGVYVRVNVTAAKTTPCGAGEWQDVFAHEFGHATGLSHSQRSATAIMRDGHYLNAQDVAEVKWIYANNARR